MKTRTYSRLALLLPLLLVLGCEAREDAPETEAPEEAVEPMAAPAADTLHAMLTGDAEVPGPGDPDGSGTAEVALSPEEGTVCFEIEVENIADAQAAHIHTGGADESGPPVVDFDVASNGLSGCVDAEAETIQSILDSPSEFYVNVHNEEFGAGAVRGQLERRM